MPMPPFDPIVARKGVEKLWSLGARFGRERGAMDVFLDEIVSDRFAVTRGFRLLRDELHLAGLQELRSQIGIVPYWFVDKTCFSRNASDLDRASRARATPLDAALAATAMPAVRKNSRRETSFMEDKILSQGSASVAPPQTNGSEFNRKERMERKEWICFSALFAIPADCPRDEWIKHGAALKHQFAPPLQGGVCLALRRPSEQRAPPL